MPGQEDIIDAIIAGSFAPSIGDLQPWSVVIVRSQDTLHSLVSACPNNEWMHSAPCIVAVTCDVGRTREYHGEHADVFARDSCAAFVQNMLLGAQQRGLSACWVSQFDVDEVSDILSCPADNQVMALVALGFDDGDARVEKHVTALNQFVFFEQHGNTATDMDARLKNYGEVARRRTQELKDASSRHANSVSVFDSFKQQVKKLAEKFSKK